MKDAPAGALDMTLAQLAQHAQRRLRAVAPGLALALAVAVLATGLSALTPRVIGPVLIAVLLGLAARNLLRLPAVLGPGLSVATTRVLRIGVVLLGARLSLRDVLSLGSMALYIAVVCMTAAFLTVTVLARLLRVPTRLAALLGVGTAVCGNSAIMATSPVIDAEDREIGFAIGTITLFGTTSLLLFPLVGRLLDLPDEVFVLGFLAVAALSSFGVISERVSSLAGDASSFLVVTAIAAVGLTTNLREIRSVGPRPVLVALGATAVLAVLGLAFAQLLR